jgi:hypothetical protein
MPLLLPHGGKQAAEQSSSLEWGIGCTFWHGGSQELNSGHQVWQQRLYLMSHFARPVCLFVFDIRAGDTAQLVGCFHAWRVGFQLHKTGLVACSPLKEAEPGSRKPENLHATANFIQSPCPVSLVFSHEHSQFSSHHSILGLCSASGNPLQYHSTGEGTWREPESQGQPWLHSEFQVSLGYLRRHLNRKEINR